MEHGCGCGGVAATGSAEQHGRNRWDNSEGDWLRDTDAAGIQCGCRHPYVQATEDTTGDLVASLMQKSYRGHERYCPVGAGEWRLFAVVQFRFGRYAGAVKVTFRFNRPESVAAWIWNCGKGLWVLSLPALIVLKLTGVIDWSWWWVALSPLWLSGSVATFRFNLPGSVGVWIWNRGQDLWVLSLPAFIVLKLTGVITWSWWWALSPLWISGILLAPVLCVLLVLLGLHMFRRAASSEELAAERYGMELRELGGDDEVGDRGTAPAAARRARQRGGPAVLTKTASHRPHHGGQRRRPAPRHRPRPPTRTGDPRYRPFSVFP